MPRPFIPYNDNDNDVTIYSISIRSNALYNTLLGTLTRLQFTIFFRKFFADAPNFGNKARP